MTIKLTIAAKSDIGRVRETNEDALLIADLERGPEGAPAGIVRFDVGARGALLAVSDGMGGHKAGEVASALTLESLFRELVAKVPAERAAGETDDRIKRAVEETNRTVFGAGRRPSLANMGATLTAILVDGGEARIAEVGDSRAYLLRGGVLRQVTEDQSLVQTLVSTGQVRAEDANDSPWRNVLLQAIGQSDDLNVAIGTLSLRQRDLLLLCSDGLTSLVNDEDIRAELLAAPSLDLACERLVALANARGGSDNVTVLLAGVSGDLPALVPDERISDTYRTLVSFDAHRRVGAGSAHHH